MRSFLQKKAGATYFSESNVTASIRKHNLEFIFTLRGGWHAVISVIPSPEGVFILACLGQISTELDRIVPTIVLKPCEHNKFTDVLEQKAGFSIMCIDADGKGIESGIGKLIKGKRMPHLQLLGDVDLHIEAEKLCNLTLELYSDLQKSSYPALKNLTKFFYD